MGGRGRRLRSPPPSNSQMRPSPPAVRRGRTRKAPVWLASGEWDSNTEEMRSLGPISPRREFRAITVGGVDEESDSDSGGEEVIGAEETGQEAGRVVELAAVEEAMQVHEAAPGQEAGHSENESSDSEDDENLEEVYWFRQDPRPSFVV